MHCRATRDMKARRGEIMQRSTRERLAIAVAGIGIGAIALTGCGAPGGGAPAATPDAGSSEAPSGDKQTVTVYGTIVDSEAELLQESWAAWAEENNIDIQYEGTQEFESQVGTRVQGGNPPDIAIFPQPGLLSTFGERGYLKPAPEAVKANAEEYFGEDWMNYGTVDGTFYGAPLMASVKGWIWYQPSVFEANGIEVPKTWDDMVAATKTLQEKTGKPAWCAGFESGDATGWPGTDWIEDVVLREHGPEVYDQWVAGEVKFEDERIQGAFNTLGELLLDPANVNAGFGDVKSINSTAFGDVAAKVASGECALTHQASFLSGFFPEGTNIAPDGDVWAFLTPDGPAGTGMVTGGGEIVGAFTDTEATQKVLEYLSSPEWANSRVALGGVISANKGLDASVATNPLLQEAIKILQDPGTTFRFDASDLMPGAVGAGSFWKGIVEWVNGTDVATVTKQIDSAWPSE